jgi:iron complex outermembrane receptor protein
MKPTIRLLALLTLLAVLLKSTAMQSFTYTDSSEAKTLQLNEVVVCDQTHYQVNYQSSNFYKTNKLSTTEEILARMMGVSLIKRGAYGMEPVLRVYSAGQINLTINGMRIYGACTDKMDPVTIYIEPNNLENIRVSHGAAGNETGSSVGGSIDMVMKQAEFSHCRKTYASAKTSYNSASRAFNAGTVLNVSFDKVAFRLNGTYRKAFDYRSSGGYIVPHSAYEKVNYGVSVAFRLPKEHRLVADYVGDIGWNIGYPALTMDAGKAIANIASLTHVWLPEKKVLQSVETKVYFNHIFHSMDDTHRNDTLMHMDMPGWSYTAGWYSEANLVTGSNNRIKLRADFANNFSRAEMTMHPENAQPMFMLTLPDNSRNFAGVYFFDEYTIAKGHNLQFNARAEYMRAELTSTFGRNQAKIFGAAQTMNRFASSASASYSASFANYFSAKLTFAYGERVPNANELYGFYLYNRFDGFDYIGNTELKNERTLQAEWNGGFEHKYISLHYAVFYNHIYNYIMGAWQTDFSAMTQGARGVKKFDNMGQALITGVEAKVLLNEIKGFQSMHTAKFSYAQLANGEPLSQIPPLKCYHVLRYSISGWHAQAEAEWALPQERVNRLSGEQATPWYALIHFRTGYKLSIKNHLLQFNFAVENLLDRNYREHLDWGNIPRPGRNFILSLSYAFSQ